jgi:hypothetical protein
MGCRIGLLQPTPLSQCFAKGEEIPVIENAGRNRAVIAQ